MRQDIRDWIALSRISSITPHRFKHLVDALGEPGCVFQTSPEEIQSRTGLQDKYCNPILEQREKVFEQTDKDLDYLSREKISVCTYKDTDYPQLLLQIHSFPPILYIKGSITEADVNSIGMVGTRRPTPYGISVTKNLSMALAEKGITIISGLARGIDTVSHQSALEMHGRTLAVLGCGLDVDYPSGSSALKERICENGALITEFPIGSYPAPFNFPVRNRIISGLSLGIIVVEAAEKSGALITADYALQQNREVFAVPGPVTYETSKGTNRLIKQGAKLVESVEDILEEIFPNSGISRVEKIKAQTLTSLALPLNEEKCLEVMGIEPLHIDQIVENTGLSSQEVSISLLNLELEGYINQVAGKRYFRNL